MHLTVDQAAERLGKSRRQLRYLIKSKRLPARKFAGRWVIDSKDLQLSEGQTRAVERRERQLRAVVEEGLGLPDAGERRPRYSVRDLKAFQIALPIHTRAAKDLGEDHPATRAELEDAREAIRDWLRTERGLRLKRRRDAVQPTSQPGTFLGFRVSRAGVAPGPKAKRRLKERLLDVDATGADHLARSLRAYRGLYVSL